MNNIVQVEFIHIGSNNSFQNLHLEYLDRLQDGAPMKTALRFYDEGGLVTEFVTSYERAQKRLYRYVDSYPALPVWKKVFSLLMQYALYKAILPCRRMEQACEALEAIAFTSFEIAVEREDRSFRPMDKNERYEALSGARKAKSVMIFVFEPNDLYADQNTIIATAM